jgi:magnesium-protoporphyrin O-methyltransferase
MSPKSSSNTGAKAKKTTRQLIQAIQAQGAEGTLLLDISGGLGDIQHELIRSGVRRATNDEASTAYMQACRAEAERQGHADQIEHIPGNFVDVSEQIPPADIVTLDRVVCCYHDMERLVRLSARKAKCLYGLVYPRDKWWVKAYVWLYHNSRHRLRRNPMRNYVHPTKAVEAVLEQNGLQCTYLNEMGRWQVALFART